MHIGFTGTQQGMSERQKEVLENNLQKVFEADDINVFHHGDCLGADVEAAMIAWKLGYKIVCHPPKDPKKRGFFHFNDVFMEPKDYLVRNHDIVDQSDLVYACPLQDFEIQRSGTWATIRYAKRQGKLEIINRR